LPSSLNPDLIRKIYTARSESVTEVTVTDISTNKSQQRTIWPDPSVLTEQETRLGVLRQAVLERLVTDYLALEFKPSTSYEDSYNAGSLPHKDLIRKHKQLLRRRRALELAELIMIKKRKLTLEPFSSGISDNKMETEDLNSTEAGPIDPDVATEKVCRPSLEKTGLKHCPAMPVAMVHFIERPEGMLFCRRLLAEEKASGVYFKAS
ncbi:unnamed protein product, partial [Protopolystoma xenopodis]